MSPECSLFHRTGQLLELLALQNYMGATALHVAAEKGHATICAQLATAGASLDTTDHSGRLALQLAVYWGHNEATAALLAAGGDPHAKGEVSPYTMSTRIRV
jgi:ankyrin repeat protein